jgi:hypothetical protein
MIYFCILAAILSSIAFVHTMPVMIYVLPACFLGVLLPPVDLAYKKTYFVHKLLLPSACVAALLSVFVFRTDHWRLAFMVFAVVYLLSRFVRLLSYRQKQLLKEQKEKDDRLALRRARTDTVEQLQGARVRDRVTIRTTHENEKWFLLMAERFSRHGWNVRIEFLDDRSQGRLRLVYTAPASPDVLSKSFRAVRTDAL